MPSLAQPRKTVLRQCRVRTWMHANEATRGAWALQRKRHFNPHCQILPSFRRSRKDPRRKNGNNGRVSKVACHYPQSQRGVGQLDNRPNQFSKLYSVLLFRHRQYLQLARGRYFWDHCWHQTRCRSASSVTIGPLHMPHRLSAQKLSLA